MTRRLRDRKTDRQNKGIDYLRLLRIMKNILVELHPAKKP
jgi:hypothetical protein